MSSLKTVAEVYLQNLGPGQRGLLITLLVYLVSLISEYEGYNDDNKESGRGYLSEKNNFLNQYLVKLGWGWTFTLVGVWRVLVNYNQKPKQSLLTFSCIIHLAAGTAVWFLFVVIIFPYIENSTGVCRVSSFLNKRDCFKAGYWWTGFDTSGHCFLLLWNILFIAEETKVFTFLKSARLKNKEGVRSDLISEGPVSWFSLLEIQLLVLSALNLVWEIMILATAFYFHSPGEKVGGCLCALFSWFIVYRIAGLGKQNSSQL
ncbi:fat storage-inducing transmembrane protein 2 [Eurytemora carolleeae]|uniref:fat storage-inducing transmembrane protein 2 n=1 Tax=Eurytemora carolleeae TaxID=1294199 RepID=UPI000C767C05|nr:fat storage-inducing transmembrane protein 2 [Eurytemora carolleeae]|eukprot:XP_023335094.1 fat storage-inducing transmembrane protein 2-like [Eurytemora affinis]